MSYLSAWYSSVFRWA